VKGAISQFQRDEGGGHRPAKLKIKKREEDEKSKESRLATWIRKRREKSGPNGIKGRQDSGNSRRPIIKIMKKKSARQKKKKKLKKDRKCRTEVKRRRGPAKGILPRKLRDEWIVCCDDGREKKLTRGPVFP